MACFLLTNPQSLARAVYSRAGILVLDDVFSGLDNRSTAAISSRLLATDGHFKGSGRTVILVTHNHRLLPFADDIVLLDSGIISRTGTYNQIRSILPEEKHNQVSEDPSEDEISVTEKTGPTTTVSKVLDAAEEENTDGIVTRRRGKWSVYGYYFQSSGRTLIALLILAIFVSAVVDKFASKNIVSGMLIID